MVWFLSISVLAGSVLFGEFVLERLEICGFGSIADVLFVYEVKRVGSSTSDEVDT